MPKKKSKKDKDFQKVKFKVGKKLPKAENVTSTAFRSRAIVIKEQLKETTTDDLRQDILRKSRNPQELLAHLQHYSASFRLNSLNTIKAIMICDHHKLTLHMGSVIDRVSALMSDKERDIRAAALECLKSIFNQLNVDTVSAFIPTIIAHLCCSMTYLTEDVKLDSLQFLDLLVFKYPQCLRQELFKLTHNFLDLISTSSSSGKRSLKVAPNSKMSTVKWRQQAFAHLENLLSIGVGDDLNRHIGSSQPMILDCKDSPPMFQSTDSSSICSRLLSRTVYHGMYISTSDLEEIVVRHTDVDAIRESDILQKFVSEILPLLRETWVELVGSDGLSDGDLCSTLLSVVRIVHQLHHMICSSEIKSTQPVLKLLRTEVIYFVTNGFPILSEGRKSAKGHRFKENRKPTTAPPTNISNSTVLNLRLCSLASVLGCTNKVTKNYMLQVLHNTSVEELGDQLDIILHSMESGEMLDGFISNMLEREEVTNSQIKVILNIIDKQLSSRQRLHEKTINALLTLIHKPHVEWEIQDSILTTISRACLCGKFSLEAGVFLPVFTECISRHTARPSSSEEELAANAAVNRQLKLLLTLLHHVDEVSIEILEPLNEMLWRLDGNSLDVVNMVLDILYARTTNQGLLLDRYLSFLFSLMGGSGARNTHKNNYVQLTKRIVRTVLHHIQMKFSNVQQIMHLLEYFYEKMLNENRSLPFCTCLALLEASYITKDLSAEFVSNVLTCYMKYFSPKYRMSELSSDENLSEHLTEESLKETLKNCSMLRQDVQEITLKNIISAVEECPDKSELEVYTEIISMAVKCHWMWDVSERVLSGLRLAFGLEDLQQLAVM